MLMLNAQSREEVELERVYRPPHSPVQAAGFELDDVEGKGHGQALALVTDVGRVHGLLLGAGDSVAVQQLRRLLTQSPVPTGTGNSDGQSRRFHGSKDTGKGDGLILNLTLTLSSPLLFPLPRLEAWSGLN